MVRILTATLNQEKTMTDFQSFRNAVLEDDDLQEAVASIINTATANGSGMGDGIQPLPRLMVTRLPQMRSMPIRTF